MGGGRRRWLEEIRLGLVQADGPHDGLGDAVRVAVARRPPVFEVALLLVGALARDSDRAAAIGHAGRERVDVGRLVETGQTARVVLAAVRVVHRDVEVVPLAQLFDGVLDDFDAVLLAHGQRGEVAVSTGAIPVADHGLRVERGKDAKFLRHSEEKRIKMQSAENSAEMCTHPFPRDFHSSQALLQKFYSDPSFLFFRYS